MATSVNKSSAAVEYYKAADLHKRNDYGVNANKAGNEEAGEQYLEKFVPTDRDYSRVERAQQQRDLHNMMILLRQERDAGR